MQSLSSFMNTIRFNFLYIDKYSFGRTWTYPESAKPYNGHCEEGTGVLYTGGLLAVM